jgi:hypothetical protein
VAEAVVISNKMAPMVVLVVALVANLVAHLAA